MPLTDNGYEVTELNDIVDEIISLAHSTENEYIVTSPTSPTGKLYTLLGQVSYTLQAVAVDVLSALDPETATGTMLDNICDMTGLYRIEGKKTTIPVSITNVSDNTDDITMYTGDSVAIDIFGNEYILSNDITISQYSTVNTVLESKEYGDFYVGIGQLSSSLGYFEIVNTSVSNVGYSTENDLELRLRRQNALSISGRNSYSSIKSKLLALSSVKDVKIIQNRLPAVDVDGRPANSTEIVILGAGYNDIMDILYNESTTTLYLVSVSNTMKKVYVDDDNNTTNIVYSNANIINLTARFTLTVKTRTPIQTLTDAINKVTININDELLIGDNIFQDTYARALKNYSFIYNIESIIFDDGIDEFLNRYDSNRTSKINIISTSIEQVIEA